MKLTVDDLIINYNKKVVKKAKRKKKKQIKVTFKQMTKWLKIGEQRKRNRFEL